MVEGLEGQFSAEGVLIRVGEPENGLARDLI